MAASNFNDDNNDNDNDNDNENDLMMMSLLMMHRRSTLTRRDSGSRSGKGSSKKVPFFIGSAIKEGVGVKGCHKGKTPFCELFFFWRPKFRLPLSTASKKRNFLAVSLNYMLVNVTAGMDPSRGVDQNSGYLTHKQKMFLFVIRTYLLSIYTYIRCKNVILLFHDRQFTKLNIYKRLQLSKMTLS